MMEQKLKKKIKQIKIRQEQEKMALKKKIDSLGPGNVFPPKAIKSFMY